MSLHPETWTALGTWALVGITGYFIHRQIASSERAAKEQLEAARRVAQLQLFVQLTERWNSNPMRALRRDFAARLIHSRDPSGLNVDPLADETVMGFFELLGYLTHKDYLIRDLVWNYFSVELGGYWSAVKPHVVKARNDQADRQLYEELEWLFGLMIRLEPKRPGDGEREEPWSDEDIEAFLEGEVRLDQAA
jgi:hypothetical protein